MAKTKGTLEWAYKNVNCSKGCPNDCRYCYSSSNANKYGWKKRDDWHNIENKDWMAAKHFRKVKNTDPELYDVMFPSSHDVVEENVDLSLKVLLKLLTPGNTVLFTTKPRLFVIERILEELPYYVQSHQLCFRFTITTLDDQVRLYWEKGASPIKERFDCLKLVFHNDGLTSISSEPFLDETIVRLIEKVHPYVTENIWVGPMNFTHVPKEYIEELRQNLYYTPDNLRRIKNEIDSLGFDNIRYKDHFLNKIKLEVST